MTLDSMTRTRSCTRTTVFLLVLAIVVSHQAVTAFGLVSPHKKSCGLEGGQSGALGYTRRSWTHLRPRSSHALYAFRFLRGEEKSPSQANNGNHKNNNQTQEALPLMETKEPATLIENIDPVPTKSIQESSNSGGRLRKLKDLVWVREALEDLTAAEFACKVESGSLKSVDQKMRRKRAVDYEKLLNLLNKRIRDLGCDLTSDPTRDTSLSCTLVPNQGSAARVYTEKQRQNLLERLVKTRKNLIEVIQGYEIVLNDEETRFELNIPDLRVEIPRESEDVNATAGPKLYVREDGTVDWDGALQDQAALRNFGTAVWARINGREPESDEDKEQDEKSGASHSHAKNAVTAKVVETVGIKEAREKMEAFQADLARLEVGHTSLLNSAIGAGQAVANVNMATLQPELRNKIIESAEELELTREQLSYHTLLYELERIYTYLAGELGNPAMKGYISLQDRLNIAEFGLLESQTESFKRQFETGDNIDGDVLLVVQEQMNDFKRRLGIDYFVTGLTFDREAIARWLADLWEQTQKTLAFYGKGCRLFWNDMIFTMSLITRAAQGYTLKPREVQTIRRTFKDVLTFIPFVIILLIPLSPVGHVLVFGAIQRFFPDFFPSCFTEQRQNLLRLYETAEYSEFTINENWKAKLSRIVEAFAFFVANTSRSVYVRFTEMVKNGAQPSVDSEELPSPNGSTKGITNSKEKTSKSKKGDSEKKDEKKT